ncbi:hypothetical protein ACFL24_01760 [Patescibacteria group bacterium]
MSEVYHGDKPAPSGTYQQIGKPSNRFYLKQGQKLPGVYKDVYVKRG